MTVEGFALPPGRSVRLPGRGDMWLWDAHGPVGAPNVVLLHGWTSTAALNWCASFRDLSSEFRVVAPDHRGHGRGIRSRRPFRLEDCADDVSAMIEVLGLGRVIVVGYSMGGPIASLVWRRHPEVVDGLVLCATAARFGTRSELSTVFGAVGAGLASALAHIPPSVISQGAAGLARLRGEDATAIAPWVRREREGGSPPALIQAGVALSSFDSTDWIGEIDVPTSVVVTTADRTVSPERQRALARSIPGASTRFVTGDHRACVDAADEFVPALLRACTEVRSASVERPR